MFTQTNHRTTTHGQISRAKTFFGKAPVGLGLFLIVAGAPRPAVAQDAYACPAEITASTPCPCRAVTDVRFKEDLTCFDSSGIIVGAGDIEIFLNGFRLQCVTFVGNPSPTAGTGFRGSCQGALVTTTTTTTPTIGTDPDPEVGIDTNGYSGVGISGAGSIVGFDIGVRVAGPATYVEVEKVNVSGPDAVGGSFASNVFQATATGDRPETRGILVTGVMCPDPFVVIERNSVDNHTQGIELNAANCVEVAGNFLHDNNSGSGDTSLGEGHGIHVNGSANARIHTNLVIDNGINQAPDSGVILRGERATGNKVVNNLVSYNNGDGISAVDGANGNRIINNTLVLNTSTEPQTPTTTPGNLTPEQRTFFDLFDAGDAGANLWDENNVCETESSPPIAANVCAPGQTTDPLQEPPEL